MAYNPKRPTYPIPLERQAACLRFAAVEHSMGYWSYLARFSDNAAFKLPDAWAWFDIPEALIAASETMALIAELARLRGDQAVKDSINAAIARVRAEEGLPADPAAEGESHGR